MPITGTPNGIGKMMPEDVVDVEVECVAGLRDAVKVDMSQAINVVDRLAPDG